MIFLFANKSVSEWDGEVEEEEMDKNYPNSNKIIDDVPLED